MIVAVLVMAACGGASESSSTTSTSASESVTVGAGAAEVVVDELISVMGGENAALAAVLLAGDLGYGVTQIVPAGLEGRLQPDGSILTAGGATVTPYYEPSRMLDNDVTGDASDVSGFKAPPRIPLTRAMEAWNASSGTPLHGLVILLMFLEQGYSLEQLVLAALAGDSPDLRANSNNSEWYLAIPLRLVDENGEVIEPERPPESDVDDLWDFAAPQRPPRPSTTVVRADDADIDAPEDQSEAEGPLSGTWIMWFIKPDGNRGDVFRIRFNGVDSGTLEILNNETEIDTFFTVDSDLVTFGFTLLSPLNPEYYTQENVPAVSFFIGEFEDDNSIDGLWENEGYSCSPADEPPCVLGAEPFTQVAGLIRES